MDKKPKTCDAVRMLIAGGRNYKFSKSDKAWLDEVRERLLPIRIVEVVSGGAPGADTEGAKWAASHAIPVRVFKADWDRYGPSAGPRRNQKMSEYLSEGQEGSCPVIGLVILFPGGRGTDNMGLAARSDGLIICPVVCTQPRWAEENVNLAINALLDS
jgi:hypothetical protein